MSRNVLHAIEESMPSCSKGQKLIAGDILANYDKAAFMTASRLGKKVGVSESTVVRFAAELGYDGYPDMQKSLQKMIRNRLTSVQRIEVTNDRIGDQDLVSMVLQSDMEKIRLTLEELDRSAFDNAVKAIVSAKRIYIIGVRSSAARWALKPGQDRPTRTARSTCFSSVSLVNGMVNLLPAALVRVC
mgnify:CR=1 FL=1